ncbi:Phosphoenolpyruvate/pyruvate domain-containing protein [Tothia fuscella]|uniref:Phosphoenolpyruvate/pyruvate domain-containing protein n=1 Tax=Tothia fuscella TaxID=1048955 RepID=A0A9P4P319_9PEZI|nr:Phosphoenolpyruvate/pyruvate domain-containing protein [Tothia fuscella]
MSVSKTSENATHLRSLHQPGRPVVFANVWDALSARAVALLPECKALATASYGVANAHGLDDDNLDMETNLQTVREAAAVAARFKKPLSVDFQDGYGDQLEAGITELIKLGVVGINLEDYDRKQMMPIEHAVDRIKRVIDTAKQTGVPDFVVNARCDVLVQGGQLDEVISRGKQYLAAGATTVFIWGGGKHGVRDEEVVKLVEAFDGRLSVSMKLAGGLTAKELCKMGVSRISVGPQLQLVAMKALTESAQAMLSI